MTDGYFWLYDMIWAGDQSYPSYDISSYARSNNEIVMSVMDARPLRGANISTDKDYSPWLAPPTVSLIPVCLL